MKNKYWNLLKESPESGLELTAHEWQAFEPFLNDHRLEGYIFKNFGPLLNQDLKEKFSLQWQVQWFRNHLYLNEFQHINQLSKSAGLTLTALKGAAMLSDLYQDLGSRQMSDLDLLIPEAQIFLFQQLLLKNGYASVQSAAWKANNFKFTLTKKIQGFDLVVELHSQLFFLENKSITWLTTTKDFTILSPTDHLTHLIGHFSYQHTFLKLFWLMDIDRWIRRKGTEIDWYRVLEVSGKLRMKKATNATLWMTHTFLGTPIPKSILRPLSLIQRIFLTENFLWHKKFNLTYYLIKYDLKDSAKDTFEYITLWIIHKFKQFFVAPRIP